MSIQSFYKDQFALVIDLRSIERNMKHATGKNIVNTQSGFLLEISKQCPEHVVLNDGLVNFVTTMCRIYNTRLLQTTLIYTIAT